MVSDIDTETESPPLPAEPTSAMLFRFVAGWAGTETVLGLFFQQLVPYLLHPDGHGFV